jgi:hypothetical protein
LIPGAINNECVGFSIIEIEKLCKESTECKAEQAYVRNQKPVPVIPLLVVPDADKVAGWGEFSYLLVNNRSQICEYQKIIVSLPQK